MRINDFFSIALMAALSAPVLANQPLTPLQLFGIDGRFELTPRGDILLFPSDDVSVLHEAPTVFAATPARAGSNARPLFALPEESNALPSGGPYGAEPIPGPFRVQRYPHPPGEFYRDGRHGVPPGWRPYAGPSWR
ncbi:MAG: hypothetical protein ACFCUG_00975 [Thiotrichales bacterium]